MNNNNNLAKANKRDELFVVLQLKQEAIQKQGQFINWIGLEPIHMNRIG